jgi:aminocarboxymuconate-semialdehyde decarboxylase
MAPDRNGPRTIDIHTHVIPRRLAESAERGEARHGITFGRDSNGRITGSVGPTTFAIAWPNLLETPEERIRAMDEMRVDMHLLSLSPLMHWYELDAGAGAPMAKEANDDVAEMVATDPERFAGLAFLPLQDPAAAVAELERCIRDHGFVGVMVGSHVNGLDWDTEELFPVLAAANDLGAFVFVHPAHGRANSFLTRYHLRNLIGNPFETTVAIASLIFGGVLDRLPDLDIGFAHGGGYACLGVDRFDRGQRARDEARAAADLPSDYLRRLYYDTLVFGHDALTYLIDVVGVDRVVLGSDYPADMGEPQPVDFIESHPDLTEDQRRLILGGNMERLLAARVGNPA